MVILWQNPTHCYSQKKTTEQKPFLEFRFTLIESGKRISFHRGQPLDSDSTGTFPIRFRSPSTGSLLECKALTFSCSTHCLTVLLFIVSLSYCLAVSLSHQFIRSSFLRHSPSHCLSVIVSFSFLLITSFIAFIWHLLL